ncbi:MAG: DUF2169 domain-containing protein [Byssovorax sp.]
MDVISLSPLRVGSTVWQSSPGRFALTVVCKATYTLAPEVSPLADEQEAINEQDNHWDDDPRRSVEAPGDLAPFKPRGDVLLVGYAYAPRKEPVLSLQARLLVGEVDKTIEVFCQRLWTKEGTLRDGARWTRMPLRYERAAGGPDTWNPVGVSDDVRPDSYGQRVVPNLQPPELHLSQPGDVIRPVGFGPLAESWLIRRERLGERARSWGDSGPLESPLLGDDFDALFFQAAPLDQQVDALRADEPIVLENLHVDHPRLVTSLPGVQPRAFVDLPGREPLALALVADTLWIDTARGICTLTWRGQIALERRDQPGRVLVGMAERGSELSWPMVARLAEARSHEQASLGPAPVSPEPSLRSSLPHAIADIDDSEVTRPRPPRPTRPTRPDISIGKEHDITRSVVRSDLPPKALPFQAAAGPVTFPARSEAARRAESSSATIVIKDLVPSTEAPAWLAPPSVQAPLPAPPPPPPLPPPRPPLVSSPMSSPAPLSSGAAASGRALEQPSFSGDVAKPLFAPPPVRPADDRLSLGDIDGKQLSAAAFVGAYAASNAAAGDQDSRSSRSSSASSAAAEPKVPVAAPPPAPPPPAAVPLELVWHASDFGKRARKNPSWSKLLSAPKRPTQARESLLGFSLGDDRPDPSGELSKSDVLNILSRAVPATAQEMRGALADGFAVSGASTPPLLLLGGELEFPFDELETLRAILGAATPLASGDKKLQATIDLVTEMMQTPLQGSPEIVEGFIERMREAWSKANRLLPPTYLETHTERMLLEQRHYQRRDLLDASWLRALLKVNDEDGKMPVYLPMHLHRRLPLFKRFPARIIVEALPQQDQYESHPVAHRALALARLLPALQRGAR